jgi:hypothetical protein
VSLPSLVVSRVTRAALSRLNVSSLPLAFYLKLFSKEISTREKVLDYFLITISSILSIVGTVWAFLPKTLIGAE